MRLPGSLARLFRNYVFDTLDDEKHAGLVIKTALAYGSWEQILWLFHHYGRERVGEVFREDHLGPRTLPESTRTLWALLFAPGHLPDDGAGAERWRGRRPPPGTG